MKSSVQIIIDGVEKNVLAEIIDKKIWFKIEGEVYNFDLLDLSDSQQRKSKSAVKSPDKILAPMPGKVTKVFVSENQEVQKGDALLVMEAMKMEYTLKADIAAKVEKVFAQVNDQVTLGFLLIQLKENKG